ncbi:MAG: TonB-dependent receptor [Gemmatimonadota bacterium]|nr:TonB-dependent receptor [Gemmatimonadota bacterium]
MLRTRLRGLTLALPILVSLFVPTHLTAQVTTGIIRGTVVDTEGEPVTDADVILSHRATGFTRTLETNALGVFAAPQLPTGAYDILVQSPSVIGDVSAEEVQVRVGETVNLRLQFQPLEVQEIIAVAEAPVVDPTETASTQRLDEDVVEGLPNNGRDYLDLTLLTPGAGIVQGPDGEELTFNGQRGIFNNVIVDGADFNNPFFGEQRGGQRPAFTFNQDAIEEIVVFNTGAPAEFGRSAGGVINVLTKSGTNEFEGTAHVFAQADELSSDFARGGGNPNFDQQQFGFTIGGPIKRNKAFFFLSYDQQEFDQTKQVNRRIVNPGELQKLENFLAGRFPQLANDFGPIDRTDDAKAFIGKVDVILNDNHNVSAKYNYTESEQINGTFDSDAWGRSANGIERDESHAFNAALHSQLSPSIANEFRFQYAREDRPRPYAGPEINPGQPFPDTGMDFADGFRFGMPFFLPIDPAFDTRFQLVNNTTVSRGNHLYKFGVEWNRTHVKQTFIGFASGRYIFSSVDGFINYVENGPTFVTCSDGSSSLNGQCPAGTSITGPLLLFLQFGPVPPLQTAEQAGTQSFSVHELAFYAQDSWKPTDNLTVNYGLRWEGTWHPDNVPPRDELFYAPFIGETKNGMEFPSDGDIPDDFENLQPRFGITWDINGDGSEILRGNAGYYFARIPMLVFAQHRSSSGAVGQTIFRASFFNDFGLPPPAYGDLIDAGASQPFLPDIQVPARELELPRTFSSSIEYERILTRQIAGFLQYSLSYSDNLFRFVNRNHDVFGNPWRTGLPAERGNPMGAGDTLNGINNLTVLESVGESIYNGITVGVKGRAANWLDLNVNYTLSWDKSHDDNERDPFTFRHADPSRLDEDWGWSDRDQRHRFNAYALLRLPHGIEWTNLIQANSAQPISEVCEDGPTGERVASQEDRVCNDGSILERNTLRKDDEFFTWDMRFSKLFQLADGIGLEVIGEVFNLFNTDNFRDPGSRNLLFNFDGTLQSGLGDPRRFQLGTKLRF